MFITPSKRSQLWKFQDYVQITAAQCKPRNHWVWTRCVALRWSIDLNSCHGCKWQAKAVFVPVPGQWSCCFWLRTWSRSSLLGECDQINKGSPTTKCNLFDFDFVARLWTPGTAEISLTNTSTSTSKSLFLQCVRNLRGAQDNHRASK